MVLTSRACTQIFIYILCQMGMRSNMQKLLGFTPPRAASQSMFPAMPSQ